jgi:RNA polymerase sigma-B factor
VATAASAARSRARERADRARRTTDVLDRLDVAADEDRPALLDELVEANLGVARSIAKRYRHRGVSDEDLQQVAYLALVRVARSYDHSTGHDFLSYAVPSIRGEVQRYFRDLGWVVRPPRRVQEVQGRISACESALSTGLGRPPTPTDLAEELGEDESDVREAMAANGCFAPTSLDQLVGATETCSIGDQLGVDERGLAAAEARVVLRPLVRRLTARQRRILEMRFFGDCTQQEIADEIGVTQMQVSRLLGSLMARMREDLLESMGSSE